MSNNFKEGCYNVLCDLADPKLDARSKTYLQWEYAGSKFDDIIDDAMNINGSITHLTELVDHIRWGGVTKDTITRYAATVWDNYDVDLNIYKDASPEQLTVCLEGLGLVIKNLYIRIKMVINVILEWIQTGSFFSKWASEAALLLRLLSEQTNACKDWGILRDEDYRHIEIVGLAYPQYQLRLGAMRDLVASIQQIMTTTNYATANTRNIEQAIHATGFVFDPVTCKITAGDNNLYQYRRGPMGAMLWSPSKHHQMGNELRTKVLVPAQDLTKYKYTLERALNNYRLKIDALLARNVMASTASDEDKIAFYVLSGLRTIVRFTTRHTNGMAQQWLGMSNRIVEAIRKRKGIPSE